MKYASECKYVKLSFVSIGVVMLHKYSKCYKLFSHMEVFSLISDFFTLTTLKIILEISSKENVSHYIMIDPDY